MPTEARAGLKLPRRLGGRICCKGSACPACQQEHFQGQPEGGAHGQREKMPLAPATQGREGLRARSALPAPRQRVP